MHSVFSAVLLAQRAVGFVWLVAGAAKLTQSSERTTARVLRFAAVPTGAASAVGKTLPCIELAVGILLLINLAVTAAAAVSESLLCVYTGLVLLRLIRRREVECDCFGELTRGFVSSWTVGRNVALILVTAFVLYGQQAAARANASSVGLRLHASTVIPTTFIIVGCCLATVMSATAAELADVLLTRDQPEAYQTGFRLIARRLRALGLLRNTR